MKNKIHDAFEQIEAAPELKQSTMEYISRIQENRLSLKHFLLNSFPQRNHCLRASVVPTTMAALCVIFMLTIGLGGYYTAQIPDSYVSIDINPSMELSLNCYERVIAAVAYNEDGQHILNTLDIIGLAYEDAIKTIVQSDEMQPYLLENATLTFTVASDNKEKEKELLDWINTYSGSIESAAHAYAADVKHAASAHECGMSLGKYSAYLLLLEYDNSITATDCHNMTIDELQSQIREHEHSQNGHQHGHEHHH